MVKKLKEKILTGLAALTFSLAPATATAQDTGEKAHRDYISVGAVSILEPEGVGGGLNVSFRKPLIDNLGILVGYSFHLTDFKEKFSAKANACLSLGPFPILLSASKQELYLGPGFMLSDGIYPILSAGSKWHIFKRGDLSDDGLYIKTEAGWVFGDKSNEGAYFELGVGWRY